MKRLNVLFVLRKLTKGGMERQTSLFLENYDRTQLNVTLLLFNDEISYALPSDIKPILIKRRSRYFDILFFIKIFIFLTKNQFDLINSKISGINELMMTYCGILRKKNLLVEIRNSGDTQKVYYKKMAILYKFFKIYWPIITNSRKACKELKSYIPDQVDIKVVTNGIDTNKFKPQSKQTNNSLRIGFVGRIKPQKNIQCLIKAIDHLHRKNPNLNLECSLIVSMQDQHYYSELLHLIKELDLKHIIRWYWDVDNPELYYQNMNIFVLPSFFEGTPNVLLEAMSIGCLCVISNEANSDDFLTDEFTFAAENHFELADRIISLNQKSENEKKDISKMNREFVLENYNIKAMTNNYTQFFQSFAGSLL